MTDDGMGPHMIVALQTDAEQLAEAYGYDVDRLWFQYNCRCFGSFTTTLAGSPKERDRYFRAWKIAFEHRAALEELTEAAL